MHWNSPTGKLRYLLLAMLLCLWSLQLSVFAAEEPPQPVLYASVLLEAKTGTVLDGVAMDTETAIGSLTKLMTVYLTADAIAAGTLTPDTVIKAAPAAQTQKGAVIWLLSGEPMTVRDLLKGVIIGNANDAAVALACHLAGSEAQFVQEMNAAAFALGMRSTRFVDCTGRAAENQSTASDVARLCKALLPYDWLTPIFTTWRDFLRGDATELVSENRMTRGYDGLLGFHAGHGTACGETLAVAVARDGMCFVAVTLGGNADQDRFAAAKALLAKGFAAYTVTTPDFSTEFLKPVTVRHGQDTAVCVTVGTLAGIATPKGTTVSCSVILPKYLEAPVRAGQVIGTAAFYCEDALIYESPLLAEEAVGRRDFADAFSILLENLFK